MIYLYDMAITEDLQNSFNPEAVPNPTVKVISPADVINLSAQMHNDEVTYPMVAITRKEATPIDSDRTNFTRMRYGVQTVLDNETNTLYREQCIPIDLRYDLTVITTNAVDRDEIVKELLFKYLQMYFISIDLPYECKRTIRFGVNIENASEISNTSATPDYLSSGTLYETSIPLKCEGAVLVSYRPEKLRRLETEVVALNTTTI